MPPAALCCRDLWRAYPLPQGQLEVLRGVDLEVTAGSVVAILGPSGSGKSTLLHLLAGLDRPDRGEIYWGELGVHTAHMNALAAARLREVGLVFQNHYLLADLTVLENVTLAGRLCGAPDAERGQALLAAVGLEARASFLPRKLSGGERQRAAVARALYARPRLVLADEPTGSLDRSSARSVYALLVDLARQEGSAVVMVTHDEGLVKDVDARFELLDGRLEPV
jgi:lipoprotein-releasing system ATP-binding protein